MFSPLSIGLRLGFLSLILAAALFVHFRGRVRLKFARQLTDHSTFTAPYNALVYLFSGVPNQSYYEPKAFADLQTLTDNWEMIRDEGLALLGEGRIAAATGHNDVGFHTFFKRGWKRFYLKWYGHPIPSAKAHCPKTTALLDSLPSVHGAMYTFLPAGGRIGRHRDPFAGSLRYHLGLRTPNSDGCWIEVDGRRASWRDGQAFVFDETYVHEALNETDVDRLILFCDVERPMQPLLRGLNRWMIHNVMGATGAPNEEGEAVGGINRFFERVHGVLDSGKKLKVKNRRLYYALKYLVIAAVVVLIL